MLFKKIKIKTHLRKELDIPSASLKARPSTERRRRLQQLHINRRPIDILDQLLQQRVSESELYCYACSGLFCVTLSRLAGSMELVALVLEVLEEFL